MGKYHGGNVERLESAWQNFIRPEFAATCSSGTIAVELALRALKLGPGDDVLMAAYDYSGNFLGVHAVGARPVLIDLVPENWQIDVALIEAAIGPATRAVIVSHLHGGIVDMSRLMEMTQRRGVPVIEDAAQSPGATVQGRMAGTWGDIGILSFGGSKLLTAGRGGALLTSRADLYQRLRLLMERGNRVAPLSELQAAVLLPQLDKLAMHNARRTESVACLQERLHDLPGLRLFANPVPNSEPVYYKVGFQFDAARFGLGRERFVAAMRAEGIAVDEGFKALHAGRSPARFHAPAPLAEADRAHAGAVVLHHPVLLCSGSEIELVAAGVRKIYANAAALAK